MWVLIGLLSGSSLFGWLHLLPDLPALMSTSNFSFVLVLLGFLVAESFVIYLPFHSHHGKVSFFEVPLVVGLLFVEPAQVWTACVTALALAYICVRPVPAVKFAFNIANASLRVVTTALALNWLLEGREVLAPQTWAITMLVVIATGLLEIGATILALSLSTGQLDLAEQRAIVRLCLVVSMANISQSLAAGVMIVAEPAGLALFIVTLLVLFLAYDAFVSERAHRRRVEFLFEVSDAFRTVKTSRDTAEVLLIKSAEIFRVNEAEIVIFPPEEDEAGQLRHFELRGGMVIETPMTVGIQAQALLVAKRTVVPRIVDTEVDKGPTAQQLVKRGYREALVGTLQREKSPHAVLVVGDRNPTATSFTSDDLELFSALVAQSAIALENDQMELALQQLRRLESELAHQANHDALTGLSNRSLFTARVSQALDNDLDVTLLYADLDDFKGINDTLGHGVGDALLIEVSRRLMSCVRPEDLVARLGGDEFAILLGANSDGSKIANRILAKLDDAFVIEGHEIFLSSSLGIADADGVYDTSELMARADLAMYEAKEQGKGTVVPFKSEMQHHLLDQQRLRTNIRRAIKFEEFVVRYQPILDLGSRKIVGAEALVRWQTPDGEILPGGFIAEAERAGLVLDIDRFVLRQVVEDLGTLDRVAPDIFLSANLSARHFHERDLVERLAAAVAGTDIDRSKLILEITETALVDDAESATNMLREIRQLGIGLALDDFGTGYSSLSHLRLFPVNIMKIAQPFIEDIGRHESETFLRAMVELGRTLGLKVLAEGIETEGQFVALDKLGCDLGQGFLMARPMPFEQLLEQVALVGAKQL